MQQQNEVKPISVKFSSQVIYVDTSEVSFSSKMSREPSASECFQVGGQPQPDLFRLCEEYTSPSLRFFLYAEHFFFGRYRVACHTFEMLESFFGFDFVSL